jgi:hypothetical protein
MTVVERALVRSTLRVPDDQWCSPTLAEFLAEATARLVQEGATGIFNISGKTRMTRADLAVALARAMALDASLTSRCRRAALNQRAARPLQGGFDTTKLTEALGTEPLESRGVAASRLRANGGPTPTSPRDRSGPAARLKRSRPRFSKRCAPTIAVAHDHARLRAGEEPRPLCGRVFGPEELSNLVDSSLDFWQTMGPYGELFETRMKRYFGARDFALVNSGSTANLTAVMALMSRQLDRPLAAGDEVITPAVTFPDDAGAAGPRRPSFRCSSIARSRPATFDPALIEAAISPRRAPS